MKDMFAFLLIGLSAMLMPFFLVTFAWTLIKYTKWLYGG